MGGPPGGLGPGTTPRDETPVLLGWMISAPSPTPGAVSRAWQMTQLTPSLRIRSCGLPASNFCGTPSAVNGSVSFPVRSVPTGPWHAVQMVPSGWPSCLFFFTASATWAIMKGLVTPWLMTDSRQSWAMVLWQLAQDFELG